MKKLQITLMTAASLLFVNCMNHDDATNVNIPLDKNAVSENAKELFGEIDPSQNWSSITQGSIIVTADADLNDIEKVQILTESPFSNSNAFVLNETNVNKGQKVKLVYDAPSVYDTLFAACVSKDNTYYVKVFTVNDSEISFTEPAASRMTRGDGTTQNKFPDASAIVLGQPKKSFNALRAEASKENNGYFTAYEKDNYSGNKWKYTEWNNDSWLNDYLWAPVDAATSNGWTIKDGNIYRNNPNPEDLTTIQWLVRYYLPKKDTNGTKLNNWKSIIEGTNYFKEYKNHFVSDGTPLTVIPLQMNTTEGNYNVIYYYYFKPEELIGKTDEQLAEFIKKLPKFKAINGYKGDNGAYHNDKEYLLPYYGDGAIEGGNKAIESLSIPKGYLIGFMNQKAKDESINLAINGCTYGFGPLNKENNHLIGHYFSAIDKTVSQQATKVWTNNGQEQTSTSAYYGSATDGMTWESPRIGIFSANKKTFLCFEDGSDCNFSDMILEINSGVEINYDPIEPQAASYVMCFEDEPEIADYDMNDVVLRGIRLNDEQIEITLIACGANDELDIKGLQNTQRLGKKEVHKFFGVTPGEGFINTVKGDKYFTPVSEVFNIDKNISVEDFLKTVSIYNRKTGKTISMPKDGEPPYAIVVPLNFRYPIERCSIINAYPDFLKWAQNRNEATDWYLNGVENRLYPDMFSEAE
jgi:hypothetical protein